MKKLLRGFGRSFKNRLIDSLAAQAVDRVIDATSRIFTRPVFVIRFESGAARVVFGSVRPAFLGQCSDVAAEFGIGTAKISGVETEGTPRLKFSHTIPPQAQQRLRNLYHA